MFPAILVLIILIFAWINFNSNPGVKTASLTLILGDSTRFFEGEVIEGMTVASALYASAEAGDIRFEYSFNKDGKFRIARINGYDDGLKDKEVAVFLNSSEILKDEIDKIKINPGDKIEIRIK